MLKQRIFLQLRLQNHVVREMSTWSICPSLLAVQVGRASTVPLLTNMAARTVICVVFPNTEERLRVCFLLLIKTQLGGPATRKELRLSLFQVGWEPLENILAV